MKSSPAKGILSDFFGNLGGQLKRNKKDIGADLKEKYNRTKESTPKAGESKYQASVRTRRATNKAKRASWKADAEYYGSAEDKAKNSEANRIKPTVTEEPESKGSYHTFSGKPGDKFKYRNRTDKKAFEGGYEFQRPGSDVWETSKTDAGTKAIHDLYMEDYEGRNVEITPIQKKSKGFKMPGYGKRK